MSPKLRRLKIVQFTIAGVSYDCQLQSWTLTTGQKAGDLFWTYCSEGEGSNSTREETDQDPSLDLTFASDWAAGGISDYLWANQNAVAEFQLDHHPDIALEHVRWTGSVLIMAPDVGGDARDNEMSEITLPLQGPPVYSRPGA